MTQLPVFITGNQHKADYLNRTLGLVLEHHKLDLDEIQSPDPNVVVEHKARQAYALLRRPVLVEDTSLVFAALSPLPGTFVKFFVEAEDGLRRLCRMLDGFNDRRAYATAVYGYYDGRTLKLFAERRLGGVITEGKPRGEGGYGWDKIFEPDGYGGRTRAELTPAEDIESYNKIRDVDSLRAFLRG